MQKYLFIFLGLLIGTTANASVMIVKPDPEKLLRETPVIDAKVKFSPVISNITSTTVNISIPKDYTISDLEKNQIYFEYGKNTICPAIYPILEYCKPKLTNKTGASTTLTELTPNTKYFARFVKDSSIKCIKAPCPTDTFMSEIVEFTTLEANLIPPPIIHFDFKRPLYYRLRGSDVTLLQTYLYDRGFTQVKPTGFYGKETERGIRKYQMNVMKIKPTGYFGKQTWTHMYGTK